MLAQNLALTRSDPDYYALELGSAVLGGGFYSTRLSIELRKNTGLVYSVGSTLQAGPHARRLLHSVRLRSAERRQGREHRRPGTAAACRIAAVGDDELLRVKALLLRQIPLAEASVDEHRARPDRPARATTCRWMSRTMPPGATSTLTAADVQAAFRKWMRPDDLVRVTQGPAPQ